MNIHEYQAKALFEKYGVPVPKGAAATTPSTTTGSHCCVTTKNA